MNIAERIYETVKTLPEKTAAEVLDFAEWLKAKQAEGESIREENALAVLAKYRGRFTAGKFNREECYDRQRICRHQPICLCRVRRTG